MKKLSLKRHQANIRNAQRSTGPVTPEGKQRSAQNAIQHGLTAQTVLLPGESVARFTELLSGFEADFNPQSSVARFQVEQLAVAAWRIRRGQVFENVLVRDYLADMDPPQAEDQVDTRTLITRAWVNSRADLAVRYETTHHRTFRHLYDRLLALECGDPEPGPSHEPNQQDTSQNKPQRNEANLPADPLECAEPEAATQYPAPTIEPNQTPRNEAEAPPPPECGELQPAITASPNQKDTSDRPAPRNEATAQRVPPTAPTPLHQPAAPQ